MYIFTITIYDIKLRKDNIFTILIYKKFVNIYKKIQNILILSWFIHIDLSTKTNFPLFKKNKIEE